MKVDDFVSPVVWSYTSTRSVELEKSSNTMPGGAIILCAIESRNKLGMLVVMSLQLSVAIGGT